MITTVTLNPCIDKTVTVSGFKAGALNRCKSVRTDAGGKGINVAVAFKNLGGEAVCTGFNYISDREIEEQHLREHDIRYRFVNVPGRVRTNLKIFDDKTGEMTEISESGERVGEEHERELERVTAELSSDSSCVVLSGSVPPGIGADIYRELACRISGYNGKIKVLLDADGEYLREGLAAKPYLIKPNLFELETLCGKTLGTDDEITGACREIINGGVNIVCVSLGGDGGIIVSKDEAYRAHGLDVPVAALQGAGDSMMAGAALAIEKNLGLEEVLRYGIASSAGSVMLPGTELCKREDFERLLPEVKIHKLG